uniref:F-box domain-containing protein n=1 Tax=Oryza punctata TaxID=4537 RepID=A0A0E0LLE7_ORYPU
MTWHKRRKVAPPLGAPVLPDEIMMEVLQWLPVKSILRFRAVCQSWAVTLSSEQFCSHHTAKTKTRSLPPKLFFISRTAGFDSTSVRISSSSDPGDLLFTLDNVRGDFIDMAPAPCHGLTLLHDAMRLEYYVFNAATRSISQLPHCQAVPSGTAGLGFDARTKEYKVVRLFREVISGHPHTRCQIYTLGGKHGDSWRLASGGVPFRFRTAATSATATSLHYKLLPVFVNGFLHWLTTPVFSSLRPHAAILSFSVTEETFRLVRSPPFALSGVHLVELSGKLCMVRDLRSISSMLEIWKLNDLYSSDWSLEHCIDLSTEHVARDLMKPNAIRVIGSAGSSGISRKKVIISTSNRKVITYDPTSETLETILSIKETHLPYQTAHSALGMISLFEESLAPVCKTNEEIALSSPLAKVIKEILLRLPGDFAVQFKLVSKQWHRFIESESFIRAYNIYNMDGMPKIRLVGKGTGGSGFSFATIKKLLQESPSKGTWLDTKLVCSKPCHGMNLISTEMEDYLYNPCTGYRYVCGTRGALALPHKIPSDRFTQEDHAFTVGNKNVGLGFDPLMQEHVIVEIFYQWRNFKTCHYHMTCSAFTCKTRRIYDVTQPPLPVSDMPPAYLAGFLYWMSEPRLCQSNTRAIVSFEIATRTFGVIQCPSCTPIRHNRCPCQSFVVELEGILCAVLANPLEEELDIWKLEHGRWDRAYKVYLKGWPGYSLGGAIAVVPMAVDPKDGRILLNTGRKLGLYDPKKRVIENLYGLDEVLRVKHADDMLHIKHTEKPSLIKIHEGYQLKCQHSVRKFRIWMSPLEHDRFFNEPPPALGKISACSSDMNSSKELNPLDTDIMPLVPIMYEDSLVSYPLAIKPRCLFRGGPYGLQVTWGLDLTSKDFSGQTLIRQEFKTLFHPDVTTTVPPRDLARLNGTNIDHSCLDLADTLLLIIGFPCPTVKRGLLFYSHHLLNYITTSLPHLHQITSTVRPHHYPATPTTLPHIASISTLYTALLNIT